MKCHVVYLQWRTPRVLFLPYHQALQEVSVTGRGSQPSSPTQVTDLIASSVVQGSLADVSPAAMGLVPSTSEGAPPVPEFWRRKKVTLKEIQSLVGLLNFA